MFEPEPRTLKRPEHNSCVPPPTSPVKPKRQYDMYEPKVPTMKQPEHNSCVTPPTSPTMEQPEPEPEAEHQARYCEDCEMWLNGLTQWKDHKIGKKHRKNVKKGPLCMRTV